MNPFLSPGDLPFSHFLITRYNVPLEGWEIDKAGTSTRDESWLKHRQHLFTTYCVPSVRHQTEKNFRWLIYCDPVTPSPFLHPMKEAIAGIKGAEIIQVSGYEECMSHIDDRLSQSGTDFVITSRLDNDDALGIIYMQTIQQHFIPHDKIILNLLNGHGYDVNAQVATRLKKIRKNHFGSLIEVRKSEGGHTSIRGFQHGAPPADFSTLNLHDKFGWLKIFHERNMKSTPFGYPVFRSDFAKWYGIDSADVKINLPDTALYSAWWLKDGLKRKIFHPDKK